MSDNKNSLNFWVEQNQRFWRTKSKAFDCLIILTGGKNYVGQQKFFEFLGPHNFDRR